jgi:nucleoside-diphosphate-sugar epimerase
LAQPFESVAPYAHSRVLITGGLGFIGSTLARRLVDCGANVTVVDSLIPEYGGNWFNLSGYESRVRVNISDVRDRFALEYLIQDQDYLFNLAGQTSHTDSMTSPEIDLAINCAAQLSILECCRKMNPGIRVVFASTRQIYGRPQYLPVDEAHPLNPVDVNGINKQAGESYHRLYSDVYGIRTTCLRLTNTYGPRMRIKDSRQTFLGVWMRRIIESRPFEVFGTGEQLRDFNYVDDCVEALMCAGAHDSLVGGIFNLGSDEVISLKDLATLLCELAVDAAFQIVPFPPHRKAIDIGDYFAKFELFSSLTGWKPSITLREGLQRSLDFYRENAVHYDINKPY